MASHHTPFCFYNDFKPHSKFKHNPPKYEITYLINLILGFRIVPNTIIKIYIFIILIIFIIVFFTIWWLIGSRYVYIMYSQCVLLILIMILNNLFFLKLPVYLTSSLKIRTASFSMWKLLFKRSSYPKKYFSLLISLDYSINLNCPMFIYTYQISTFRMKTI